MGLGTCMGHEWCLHWLVGCCAAKCHITTQALSYLPQAPPVMKAIPSILCSMHLAEVALACESEVTEEGPVLLGGQLVLEKPATHGSARTWWHQASFLACPNPKWPSKFAWHIKFCRCMRPAAKFQIECFMPPCPHAPMPEVLGLGFWLVRLCICLACQCSAGRPWFARQFLLTCFWQSLLKPLGHPPPTNWKQQTPFVWGKLMKPKWLWHCAVYSWDHTAWSPRATATSASVYSKLSCWKTHPIQFQYVGLIPAMQLFSTHTSSTFGSHRWCPNKARTNINIAQLILIMLWLWVWYLFLLDHPQAFKLAGIVAKWPHAPTRSQLHFPCRRCHQAWQWTSSQPNIAGNPMAGLQPTPSKGEPKGYHRSNLHNEPYTNSCTPPLP